MKADGSGERMDRCADGVAKASMAGRLLAVRRRCKNRSGEPVEFLGSLRSAGRGERDDGLRCERRDVISSARAAAGRATSMTAGGTAATSSSRTALARLELKTKMRKFLTELMGKGSPNSNRVCK